jgi:hypothetical protein
MKAKTSFCFCTVAILAFSLLLNATASMRPVAAQKQKLTTTTVADNKLGEGGSLETTSDEKAKLLSEVWKDKEGKKKETHVYEYNGKTLTRETWTFWNDNKPLAIFYYDPAKEMFTIAFDKYGSNDPYREERSVVDKYIEAIEKQFAKDGTIVFPDSKDARKPEEPAKPNLKPVPVAGTIDPCLVGVWESTLVTFVQGDPVQLNGIILSIRGDGVIALDYSHTQPIQVDADPTFLRWTGTAEGRITTSNGVANVTTVKAGVTFTTTRPNRPTTESRERGLGPASLGAPPDHTYTCDATTLRYQRVWYLFTFKRHGIAPR